MKYYPTHRQITVLGARILTGFCFLIVVKSTGVGAAAESVRYKINPTHSQFMVYVYKGGLFKAFGHNHTVAIHDFQGEAHATEGALEAASLQMTIKSNSLTVVDKDHVDDRPKVERTMREHVLETTKYPEIVFKSTKVTATKTAEHNYQAKIWGSLTLHGVTHPEVLTAQVTFNGNSLRAHGDFTIRQTNYHIKPISVVGGTVKVKDEVKLSFNIEAEREG